MLNSCMEHDMYFRIPCRAAATPLMTPLLLQRKQYRDCPAVEGSKVNFSNLSQVEKV